MFHREKKAHKLVAAARSVDANVTADEIAALSDEDWANLTKLAGCRPPSDETKELVVRIARIRG